MDPDLRLFDCEHLPPHLREVARPFRKLALQVSDRHPFSTCTSGGVVNERAVALRKLLEAKDAAVRCVVLERQDASNG